MMGNLELSSDLIDEGGRISPNPTQSMDISLSMQRLNGENHSMTVM